MEIVTVSACIGCGSLEVLNACATDCVQQRRDLVTAGDVEEMQRFCDDAERRIAGLATVAATVPAADPGRTGHRRLAAQARRVRRAAGGTAPPVPEQADEHVTWWCPDCGGLEAPQPCLGVCIREPVAMVDAEEHRRARRHALELAATERRLRRVLGLLAWTSPRDGRREQWWDAIRHEAVG